MGRIQIIANMPDILIDRYNELPFYAINVLQTYISEVFVMNLNSLYYWLKKEGKLPKKPLRRI